MKTDDVLLTPAQYAKKYPVSRSTIYSACQDGLLAHYRVPAKRGKKGKYLIAESDFVAWLESNRREASGETPPPAPKPAKQPFQHLKL